MHGVKRSVCPKQKVHTSLSDLSHSTAKVKPHYPPLSESQTQLSPVVTKLGPWGARWCAVWQSLPPLSLLVGCRRLTARTKRKSYHTVFQICSVHRQKKTGSAENELTMPPKLSTACSHAAELDKVLSMKFLLNYLSGFRTTYLTQHLHRATWAPVWLSPHPSPAVPQGPQSSSDPPWVSQPFTRGCPPS